MKWHYRLVLVFKTKLHLLGGNAALKRSLFYQGEEEEKSSTGRCVCSVNGSHNSWIEEFGTSIKLKALIASAFKSMGLISKFGSFLSDYCRKVESKPIFKDVPASNNT